MAFELVIAESEGRQGRFRFDAGEVTIGRAAENDLVVHDPRASRSHARIRARSDGYGLLDEGSRNGTQVNEQPACGATRLRDGDRIRLGNTVLEFAVRQESKALATTSQVFASLAAVVGRWPLRVRVAVGAAMAAALVAGMLAGVVTVRRRAAAASLRTAPDTAEHERTAGSAPEVRNAAEMFPDAVGELRGIREAYERGRRKLEERRIAPRNLYDAWRAFTAAAKALEGAGAEAVAPGSTASVNLAALIRWTERELERECKRLLFAAARSERYAQQAQVQTAYRDVLLEFPGDDPSGCRRKAQEALVSLETMAPAGGVFGYPEER
jgi:pSer/pThr/pTyr-binding forkhead associated (FHA) protein